MNPTIDRAGEKFAWILASASPRRREILAGLGLEFYVDPSNLPEPGRRRQETPAEYAVRIALLKIRDVAKRHATGILIGADTVVVLGDSILGKPSCAREARTMLQDLSGRWHEVVSGIGVLDCGSRRILADHSRTRVHFRRLSKGDIDWYLDTGEYLDKAGAYGVQGFASLFVDRIDGCYYNIVGFPVATFENLCRKLGIDLITQISVRRPQSAVGSRQSSVRSGNRNKSGRRSAAN